MHLFSLVTAAPVLVYYLVRWLLRPRPLPNFPLAPGAVPLFGHSLDLIRWMVKHGNVGAWFHQRLEEMGGVNLVQIMSSWTTSFILVIDPAQIEAVYASSDFDRSDMQAGIFKGLIPKAMLSHKTDALVKGHRIAFAYSASPAFFSLAGRYFSSHFELVLAKWAKTATGEGTFFRVEDDLRLLMTDVIAQTSFGESFHQFETGRAHPVPDAMDTLIKSLSAGMFVGLQHWIQRQRPMYKAAYRTLEEYLATRVERAREKIRDGGEIAEIECLIDIVMRKEARDGEGNVMPEDELRDEMLLSLIAGQETTSSTQLWALKTLSEHPHVQRTLHRALVSVLPSSAERTLTTADLNPEATPYLEAVVHEILRLNAVFTFVQRQANRDTTLPSSAHTGDDPLPIPKGSTLNLMHFYTSTHCRDGKDLDTFRPERWLDPKTGAFDPTRVWSRPFGGGGRMCYGYKMALVFLRLFLAQLSLAYFVLPLPDELRTEGVKHYVSRRPERNFVGLQKWED